MALGFMDRVEIHAGSPEPVRCVGTIWGTVAVKDRVLLADIDCVWVMWDGPSWSPTGTRLGMEIPEELTKLEEG